MGKLSLNLPKVSTSPGLSTVVLPLAALAPFTFSPFFVSRSVTQSKEQPGERSS
jgi:hypothetical protein